MRMALFTIALATGAGSFGAMHGSFSLPNQMGQAITALGGDPSKLGPINVDPRQAYDTVIRRVTQGGGVPADLHPSVVTVTPDSFSRMPQMVITGPNQQAPFAASALSQMRQNNIRMQDMAAYARNPAGWHGMPPH